MVRVRYLILAAAAFLSCTGTSAPDREPFPALYEEARPFLAAIQQTKAAPLAEKITGITVPASSSGGGPDCRGLGPGLHSGLQSYHYFESGPLFPEPDPVCRVPAKFSDRIGAARVLMKPR